MSLWMNIAKMLWLLNMHVGTKLAKFKFMVVILDVKPTWIEMNLIGF